MRRVATVVLTVVAALASIATSDPIATVSADPVSGRVELSPDQPETRIPFTFTVSEEATSGDKRVYVNVAPTWIDTPTSVVNRGLDVAIETPAGIIRDLGRCRRDCVGSNVLVLRWPLEAETGRVLVSWSLTPTVEFQGLDDPPDGATVNFTADPPPSIPSIAPAAEAALANPLGMAVTHLNVTASDPAAAPLLTRTGGRNDALQLLISNGDNWIEIRPQEAYTGLLSGCTAYPCDTSAVVVAMPSPAFDTNLLNQTISIEDPSEQTTVVLDPQQPWQTPITVHNESLLLSRESPATAFPVLIRLPHDVGNSPTIVHIETVATATDIAARVDISAYNSTLARTTSLGFVDETKTSDSRSLAMVPQCDIDGCETQFEVTASLRATSLADDARNTTVEIELKVSFVFQTHQADLPQLVLEVGVPE